MRKAPILNGGYRRVGPWLMVMLLAGCGSTPQTRYYLLTANPAIDAPAASERTPVAGTPANSNRAARQRRIGLGPIQISEYLQRPQIVTSDGRSSLTLAEFDRWAEPLQESVSRVLIEHLTQLTGAPVIAFPWRRDERPDISLRLNIQHLDRQPGRAWLRAHWRLSSGKNRSLIGEGQVSLTQPLTDDRYDTLTAAYSELLKSLSVHLVNELQETVSADD